MLAQSEKELKDMVLAHYQPSGNQTKKAGVRKHQKDLVAELRQRSGKKSLKEMLGDVVSQSWNGGEVRPPERWQGTTGLDDKTARRKPATFQT